MVDVFPRRQAPVGVPGDRPGRAVGQDPKGDGCGRAEHGCSRRAVTLRKRDGHNFDMMTSDSRCRRVTNSQLGDSRSDRCVIGREEYLLPGRRSRVLVILAVPGPGTREMALVAQGLEGSETSGRERAGGWPLNWKRRPFRYGARTREAAAQYYSTAHARSTTRPMQRPGCGCGCKPDGGGTARPRVVSCNGQYSARTIPRCTKQLAPHPLARFLEWVPSSHSPFAPSALSPS